MAASRKHARFEPEDLQEDKRCRHDDTSSTEVPILKYNPSFITDHRTCPTSPGYTVEELRKIARKLGIMPKGMSKMELVAAIRTKPA